MECKQEYHLDPQTIKKQILREQKIRKYYEQLHANKFDNLRKMWKILEKYKLPNSFKKKQTICA